MLSSEKYENLRFAREAQVSALEDRVHHKVDLWTEELNQETVIMTEEEFLQRFENRGLAILYLRSLGYEVTAEWSPQRGHLWWKIPEKQGLRITVKP